MKIMSIADITPAGSAVPLTTHDITATWVRLTAKGNTVRFGDDQIGSARGSAIPDGVSVLLPRAAIEQGGYPLSTICVYASGSDSVSVTAGV